VVEEMAIASGVPVPAVYVMEEETAINAFAAGLTTGDAVVAVTRGTLDKLNRDELQGVIGHEFSHILNGDMRLNLRIAAVIFGILVLGLTGRGILWSLRGVRVRGKDNGFIVVIALAGLALLVVGYVGYFFGRLIQAAVSRQREFLADASAVQFTRNPSGLTGALKKIGGYAAGSTMASNRAGEIGHFFFAQAFRSGFSGLWATHPPLDERIRAIDPQFDGKLLAPPETADDGEEAFAAASAIAPRKMQEPSARIQTTAAPAAIQSIGVISPAQIANAQLLLEAIPNRLKEAAHSPKEAPVLVYALVLGAEPATRAKQRAMVAERAGAEAGRILDELTPALAAVGDAQKLPLLQLSAPALRALLGSELSAFLDTLDELVHADAQVTTFEFALQKLLIRTLELGRKPGAAAIDYHSFQAVAGEISMVLSALALAATSEPAAAQPAFRAGAAQLKLIESRLQFVESAAGDFAALDTALDKLAKASGPIKQRTLMAAAQVVIADGQLLVTEAELLRAIAAALDCPMPPLGAG
jgi:Zn-dependent protease with chaperone function